MTFLQQFGARVKQLLDTKANKGTTLEEYGITDAINVSEKGAANGIASLDSGGKVPANQLPSFVDDVLEYSALSSFPADGETGKIYVAIDTNKTYRWSGSTYIEISPTAGNADSATKFATARKINGVDFDGTKDITINAVDSTARIASSEKGAANGVASLGADRKVPIAQLPATTASGLGIGQNWQDVKASRALGTTYTNTTGKPIMVAVSILATSNGITKSFYINGAVVGTNMVSYNGANLFTFIIPDGSTYSANASSSSISQWYELR